MKKKKTKAPRKAPRTRPRRVLLPEFKALMAKGSTGKDTLQSDLDDIRGDR